jgi:hypothetical protein
MPGVLTGRWLQGLSVREEWNEQQILLPHKKSPGMDGIFLAMLQEGWRVFVPYLVRIFRACLSTGYVSAMWR